MRPIKKVNCCLAVFAIVLMIGCGGKSFEYESGNEIPSGGGVFSGNDGEFTVYDSASDKKKKAAAEAEKTAATPEAASGGVTDQDQAEFEQFQEWKKEKSEFEAFQEWKKTQQGTAEYEEFKEWQRWKEYQQWQQNRSKSP